MIGIVPQIKTHGSNVMPVDTSLLNEFSEDMWVALEGVHRIKYAHSLSAELTESFAERERDTWSDVVKAWSEQVGVVIQRGLVVERHRVCASVVDSDFAAANG